MKYNIKDILEVLSESTQDEIYDEIYMEKLETNILDRTIKKKMTLYHGSIKNLSTIKPTSINMGTRLSKMRLSSFWAKEKETCIVWAITTLFYKVKLPYLASIKDNRIYTIDQAYSHDSNPKVFKHVSEWLKKEYNEFPIYIYTLKDVPVKKIGRGQVNVGEYTLDEEVKPTSKEKLSWNDVTKYIEYIPKDKFIEKSKERSELLGRRGKDASFTEKLLYRDGEKTLKKRMDTYHKAFDQYDNHIGNHQKLGDVFITDLDSVKKNK